MYPRETRRIRLFNARGRSLRSPSEISIRSDFYSALCVFRSAAEDVIVSTFLMVNMASFSFATSTPLFSLFR